MTNTPTQTNFLAVIAAYELAIDNFCAGRLTTTSEVPECNSRIYKLNEKFKVFKMEQLEAVAAEIAARPAPVGYLPAYELRRLESGHDAQLRSAKFGPSVLDGDIPVYTANAQPDPAMAGDTARYRAFRAAAIGDDHVFLDAVESYADNHFADRAHPTQAEFDASLDAGVAAMQQGGQS